MTAIRSHQWLEIQPVGLEASQGRVLRPEERELLAALRTAPVRMVDLFRRLRVTDGRQFQDLLARAVGRGWVVAHDQSPEAAPPPPVEASPSPAPADALGALLARYAADAHRDDVEAGTPAWERAPVPPVLEPASAPVEGAPATAPTSPSPPSYPAPAAAPDADALAGGGEESPSDPWARDAEEPWKEEPVRAPIPDRVDVGPEGADELFAAMGIDASKADKLLPPRSDDTARPAPPRSSGGHSNQALLEALAQAAPSAVPSAPVTVPEYGLPAADTAPRAPSSGAFPLLRDVGAVVGPGDSEPGGASEDAAPPPPKQDVFEDPTTRTRRRRSAREKMLDAARREEADRLAAKERAAAFQAKKAAEEAARKESVGRQKAQENLERSGTFMDRVERARRLRQGQDAAKKD